MTADIKTISSNNVSIAWAKAFLRVMERGVKEISPLVVTITYGDDNTISEKSEIRNLLDKRILSLKPNYSKLQQCHTVANTIFPDSMWNPTETDSAQQLFTRFEKVWPRLKRCSQNRRGSYFRRLTAYRSNDTLKPVNQLEHIINTYKGGNHRRSALQGAIFDPFLDHNNSRQLGFPCLHQVAFTPDGNSGLTITGFYATQYLFDRAYGNYLGLCRLGLFMANQMGLKPTRMNCIASVALLGTPTKNELQLMAGQLRRLIDNEGNPL